MDYQRINLDEYILSGAGGTTLTYTHKTEKTSGKITLLQDLHKPLRETHFFLADGAAHGCSVDYLLNN